jgi:NADP-dependent 3-hydroxy acid dehydrogenase YdfG
LIQKIPSAVVLGVGPEQGLGAALARKFASEGLHVFIGGRSKNKLKHVAEGIRKQGGQSTPVITDATIEQQVWLLFEMANNNGYNLELAVYNVDSIFSAPLLETDVEQFTQLWQQNCLGGFIFGKQAISRLCKHKQGTVIYTGATASVRTKPPFTSFSSAKSGLRALAQGMAKEFAPQRIHVAHVILNGVIDGERSRTSFPALVSSKAENGLLNLEAIADTYWFLHCQPASTWTHEMDLRPFNEPF